MSQITSRNTKIKGELGKLRRILLQIGKDWGFFRTVKLVYNHNIEDDNVKLMLKMMIQTALRQHYSTQISD